MKELLNILLEKGLTLGSIESMTGGFFASEITSVPGASKVYKGSLITYQVEEKIKLLKIDPKIIEEFGVVSDEVAIEMAEKGRVILNVDIAISVTGNAGPTTEPGGKPVGDVCLAIATKDETITTELILSGERNVIREKCVKEMINFLEKIINEK